MATYNSIIICAILEDLLFFRCQAISGVHRVALCKGPWQHPSTKTNEYTSMKKWWCSSAFQSSISSSWLDIIVFFWFNPVYHPHLLQPAPELRLLRRCRLLTQNHLTTGMIPRLHHLQVNKPIHCLVTVASRTTKGRDAIDLGISSQQVSPPSPSRIGEVEVQTSWPVVQNSVGSPVEKLFQKSQLDPGYI